MRWYGFVLGVMALLLGIGLGLWFFSPPKNPPIGPDVVALVNGEPITIDEVTQRIQETFPEEVDPGVKFQEMVSLIGPQMVKEELLLGYARREGIETDPNHQAIFLEVLDNTADSSNRSMPGVEELIRMERDLRLLQTELELASTRETPTEEEIQAYHEQHPEKFIKPGERVLRRIVFRTEQEAVRARNRLVLGNDFAAMANQESITEDRRNGGLLAPLPNRSFNRLPYASAIQDLQEGEISAIVETPVGHQIFRLESYTPDTPQSYEEARYKALALLLDERGRQVVRSWLRQQEKEGHVTWNSVYFPRNDDPWNALGAGDGSGETAR